ncbi:DUF6220 domain-containing protein [Planobispora siamensis]|uniref:Uncharacterized protein n=1 Tax=Planobispora siamensis TaxID=936338 RepID=A0A8J3WJG6_9ACTN|nr:DUF6220 domain-containing protein [Planobispora siamensis]GIH92929.1 hypothetical protein Psi01_35590 [Planobispora siamensis]
MTGTSTARPARPSFARQAYVVLCVLLLGAVVIQFYFAAFGVFTTPENDSQFIMHRINGSGAIPLLVILATITAAIAKAPGRLIGFTLLPLGLIVLQIVWFLLAAVTGSSEEQTNVVGQAILGLHAVNGLVILWVCILLVRRARALAETGLAPAPAEVSGASGAPVEPSPDGAEASSDGSETSPDRAGAFPDGSEASRVVPLPERVQAAADPPQTSPDQR